MSQKLLTRGCLELELERLHRLVCETIDMTEKGLKLDEELLYTEGFREDEETHKYLKKAIKLREKRLYYLYRLRNRLQEFLFELRNFVPLW